MLIRTNRRKTSIPVEVDAQTERLRARLEQLLLAIDGKRVEWEEEDAFLIDLAVDGKLMTRPIEVHPGIERYNHWNSLALWTNDPKNSEMIAGYALDENGVWRFHTWVKKDGKVFETKEKKARYFGIKLNPRKSFWFWANAVMVDICSNFDEEYLSGRDGPNDF